MTDHTPAHGEGRERVESAVRQYARGAHILGKSDEERRWLDVLALLERTPAPVQPAATGESAVRLTEAERKQFWHDVCRWNDMDDGFGRDVPSNAILYAAVERILTARLAATGGGGLRGRVTEALVDIEAHRDNTEETLHEFEDGYSVGMSDAGNLIRAALAAVPEPAPTGQDVEAQVAEVLAAHEMVGKSVPAGEHDCRLITKPHDGCGCTRIVVGCTGCEWVADADGTQGDAHLAHVAAALRAAGLVAG